MTVADKIRAYLKEHDISQAQFGRLTGVHESNISWILSERSDKPVSLGNASRIAAVMDCLIDDLVNEELDYPLPKRGERPRQLTRPEQIVISLAHEMSRDDPRPADLDTARKLLTGRILPAQILPAGPLYPVPAQPALPAPEPPTEGDGGKRRR